MNSTTERHQRLLNRHTRLRCVRRELWRLQDFIEKNGDAKTFEEVVRRVNRVRRHLDMIERMWKVMYPAKGAA